MRIVFAGTPEPALPSLRLGIDSPSHDVVAVLTRPDAVAGRRGKPSPSPVARLALESGIPILRQTLPNSDEFVSQLADLSARRVCGRGRGALLRDGLLAVPTHGWINLHFSLLPAWRGAAPVQAAIAAGDAVTGATTFQIEPALDSGPVYGVVTETIPTHRHRRGSAWQAGRLGCRAAGDDAGRHRGRPACRRYLSLPRASPSRRRSPSRTRECVGTCPPTSSSAGSARSHRTRAPGPLSVTCGSNSGPSPSTHRTRCRPAQSGSAAPGVRIGTASAPVLLGTVQPPGKKQMDAAAWARGARLDESATAS